MKNYYRAYEKQVWDIVRLIVVVIAVCTIVYSAVQAIKIIFDTGEQYYRVQERVEENVEIHIASYQKEFEAVSSAITYLEVEALFEEQVSGEMQWQIKGIDGEPVSKYQEDQIQKFQNKNGNGLQLNVENIGLEQGQRYVLSVDFKECQGLSVVISDQGLKITQYYMFMHKTLFIIIIMLCCFLGIILMIGAIKSKMSSACYVAVALFIGIMAVFLQPPASQDDEYRHFIRAYTLANGQWEIGLSPINWDEYGVVTAGADGSDYIVAVPIEVREVCLLDYGENYNNISYFAEVNRQFCLDKLLSILISPEQKDEVLVSAAVTSQKGLANYWPQVFAIWLAQHLGIRSILLPYVARIGQLLICIVFGWLALKLTPKYKNIIWLLSLIPNAMILKASSNCDGLLFAETMLLASVILWMREKRIDILSKQAIVADIGIVILLWQIFSIKLPDIFFGLGLLLLLGWDNIGQEVCFLKRYWKAVLLLIFIMMGGGIFWILRAGCGKILLSAIYQFVPQWHMEYMIDHPKEIFSLFIREAINQCKGLLWAMNGQNVLPLWVIIVVGLVSCKRELPLVKRLLMIILMGGMILLMVLVGFTMMPPDVGYIWGITYRYLFPFLPAFGLILPSGTKLSEQRMEIVYPALLIMTEVTTGISWLIWLNRL